MLLGCGMAIFAFCWLRVWLVSQLDTSRFQAIIDLLPDDWRRFTPVDFDWLITYTGRISLVYDELIVVLCMSIWGIARGSDSVSGSLVAVRWNPCWHSHTAAGGSWRPFADDHRRSGTTGRLGLARHGRGHLHQQRARGGAAAVGTALPRSRLGILRADSLRRKRAAANPDARPSRHSRVSAGSREPVRAGLSAGCLQHADVRLGSLSLADDRHSRWNVRCPVIVKVVGLASDSWSWLLYLTVFTAYEPEHFVQIADRSPERAWSWFLYDERGEWLAYGPLWYDGLLIALGSACFAAAFLIFQRRDIPAPL